MLEVLNMVKKPHFLYISGVTCIEILIFYTYRFAIIN